MTESTVVTAEDMDAARVAQLTELRAYLAAALPLFTEIKNSNLGGYQLWFGGLPSPLTQAESQLNHCVQLITSSFPVPAA